MQKLFFPQEIEVWYILPLIRKHLAVRLNGEGLSQKEVASLMHLTEAAISQYKKEKRGNEIFFDSNFNEELNKAIIRIMKDKSRVYAEIIKLNSLVQSSGFLCELHKKKSALKNGQLPCLSCKYSQKEN